MRKLWKRKILQVIKFSSSNIKIFFIYFRKWNLLVKNKIFLIFREMELSSFILFLYFGREPYELGKWKKPTLKTFLIFDEMTSLENFWYFFLKKKFSFFMRERAKNKKFLFFLKDESLIFFIRIFSIRIFSIRIIRRNFCCQ